MATVKERFLKYVKVNTKSDLGSETSPSTPDQFNLAHLLVDEMQAMGLEDVTIDENCYVMATLPANTIKNIPTMGLIAHLDTAPDMGGEGVNPQIIENYDGGDIVLNKEAGIVMTLDMFPELAKYKGQELITTDGTTLLGADDKAGIAITLTAMEYLLNHPEVEHGKIRIAFTPDEEVGKGADHFDVEKFGAEFAYTVDGGEIGELEYETFSAAWGYVTVNGRNVHPGSAKNKMLNSIIVGMEFNAMLPVNERPEFTEGREGFFHIMGVDASVELTKMMYIIRDHDKVVFEKRKALFMETGEFLNKKYGAGVVQTTVKDSYYNMREKIEPVYWIVELASDAMKSLGIEPNIVPVRGGTDGSRLSYMGLPCPNLFTGGMYYHGKYECIPTRSMELSVLMVIKIISMLAKK